MHAGLETELGKRIKSVLASGGFVDDDLTSEVITSGIKGEMVLVDGYPRTVPQSEYLDYYLGRKGGRVASAMFLDVSEKVILGRIEDRWIHAPSGRTYNYSFNPPKIHGKDDVTGEPLSKRPDDDIVSNPASIPIINLSNPIPNLQNVFRKRLEVFRDMTEPLLDYYSRQGKLKVFKGNTSDELFPLLEKYLKPELD
ncbi:hypothetical protein HDU97_004659 [Phlyctochytrium planicorne]|nr:hypothetical protein HDU97_004659 [Phlyctochytrium planicorne]